MHDRDGRDYDQDHASQNQKNIRQPGKIPFLLVQVFVRGTPVVVITVVKIVLYGVLPFLFHVIHLSFMQKAGLFPSPLSDMICPEPSLRLTLGRDLPAGSGIPRSPVRLLPAL